MTDERQSDVASPAAEPELATEPAVSTEPGVATEPVLATEPAGPPASEPVADPPAEPTSTADRLPVTARGDVVVSMRGVSRAFDKRTVVRGIDLTVLAGTILGVIGPSGAGKTTTIRMLTGALEPTSGEIEVLGQRPTSFRARVRERIGYMPQHFALYPDLTARENIDFVASLFGLLWYRRRRRVREVLKLVQLWDARDTRAGRLSGGMQRRLELASALVHQPTLLILDEPTAGIDPLLRVTIWEELHRLRDSGQTLLVTTQYVHEAEECDQVALIAHGRLIALSTPDELRRSATGGDVIEVETNGMFEGSTVESVPGVLAVRQLDARRFRVTVEDAARIMPALVEAVGSAGGDVASAREVRLTFDEVFAELVARAGDEDAAESDEAEVAADDGRGTAA
jgi:ABC-2 type transport system ATP-binding protein